MRYSRSDSGIASMTSSSIVVGLVELLGGVALIAGIGTRIVAAVLAADMVGAIVIARQLRLGRDIESTVSRS